MPAVTIQPRHLILIKATLVADGTGKCHFAGPPPAAT
jgi:hypothetical protein